MDYVQPFYKISPKDFISSFLVIQLTNTQTGRWKHNLLARVTEMTNISRAIDGVVFIHCRLTLPADGAVQKIDSEMTWVAGVKLLQSRSWLKLRRTTTDTNPNRRMPRSAPDIYAVHTESSSYTALAAYSERETDAYGALLMSKNSIVLC